MHELILTYRANGRDIVTSTQWFDKSIMDAHFIHLVQLLRVMPKRKEREEWKIAPAAKNP